jgi:hypothetical protein
MNRVILISGLIIFIACGLIIILWAIPFLLPPTEREPPIALSDLIVTTDVFPPGWKMVGTPEPEPEQFELDWGEDNVFTRFQLMVNQGSATHYIFKFRNEASAKFGLFRIRRQGYLFPSTRIPPEGWKYRSPIADYWVFGCTDAKVCTALGRYDEFISVFRTSINPDYMSLEALEDILKVIDETISKHIMMGN